MRVATSVFDGATEVLALVAALEARDPTTARHTRRVIELAERVAIRMGMSDGGVAEVAQVAALHDIGKLATPDDVLFKPRTLDEVELAIMREHVEAGARLIAQVPALAHLAPAVRATHERWDGTGYPDRLVGAMIPLASRIVFVCDAFDSMMTRSPQRAAFDREAAVDELRRCSAAQFCPRCTAALLAVLAFERDTALV